MSVVVTCTITVAEQKYELDSSDMEIFTERAWANSTGTFASLPAQFIEKFIEAAIEKAHKGAVDKLTVIKGK